MNAHQHHSGHPPAQPSSPADLKDPVCGMTVTTQSAHQFTHEGRPYYFCSSKCKGKSWRIHFSTLFQPRRPTPNRWLPERFTHATEQGGRASLWLAMQGAYDLWQARQAVKKRPLKVRHAVTA